MAKNIACNVSNRDELISLAQHGKITSADAEARAAEIGWPPFEQQPALPAFDPMGEPRWSLAMALAWIAWRDIDLVREQHAGFRAASTQWLFREWQGPAADGQSFQQYAGYFLEPWSKSSATRLSLLETVLESRDELPSTRQMSIADARNILWKALSEGALIAEALDRTGKPVEIPKVEWSYLQLYEEQELDVLKYHVLDGSAFADIKFRREELLSLWHENTYVPVQLEDSFLIDDVMIEPVENHSDGYVPLCSALHWLMTRGGVLRLPLNDEKAWEAACEKLIPAIHSGSVELIGLRRGGALTERIPGHLLTLLKVLHPLSGDSADMLLTAPSHIVCTPFLDHQHWSGDCNDRLYLRGQPRPAWTHLQVLKADVLERCPRPEQRAKPQKDCLEWLSAQMQASPGHRPKNKETFRTEARARFPF